MNTARLLSHLKRAAESGYAVIDLETTGLDPARCEIAEIGMLVYRLGQPALPKSWLVNCVVTPESEKVTGITQRMADGGLPLKEAIAAASAESVGIAFFVGHNYLRYDALVFAHAGPIVEAEIAFANQEMVIDTAALFKGGRLGREMRDGETLFDYQMRVLDEKVFGLKYNLAYVCDELGINHGDCQAHRALGDVVMTHRIFQAILGKLESYQARKEAMTA